MLKHYTYLIRYASGKLYHGVRSCDCEIIDDDYYGSSKFTPTDVIDKEILTTHSSREEAILEEVRYHSQYDVKNNDNYYNRANQTSTGFDRKGTKFSLTPEQNEKRRLSHVGSKRSKETCENIRNGQLGKTLSEEHKTKVGDAHRGMKRSKETCESISRSKMGKTASSKTKQILKDAISNKHTSFNQGGTNHWSWVAHTYG